MLQLRRATLTTPKTTQRLVACFGTIQLITSLSVMSYREKEQQELGLNYQNYLVITPLLASQDQNGEFADFIERMARSVCTWEKVVYLSSEQLNAIAQKLKVQGLPKITLLLQALLGVTHPDEIYLSREWRFENQLLMNVYSSAQKICYGDGIGIYFPDKTFLTTKQLKKVNEHFDYLYLLLKENLKSLIPQNKFINKKKFDIGYFSLPFAFGEVPPMDFVVLAQDAYLQIFQKLRQQLCCLINIKYIEELRDRLKKTSVSILLTSNFSEASERMSIANEIAAYETFLKSQDNTASSVLIIKPHPRDSRFKLLKLKSALEKLYRDVILLDEPGLFYLPFELIFMEIFLDKGLRLDRVNFPNLKIYTFSSSCLTLELLFNTHCIVGFGSNIVKQFFDNEQVANRVKHEQDLQTTIYNISRLSNSDCLIAL